MSDTEIVSAEEGLQLDLAGLAEVINTRIDTITGHEDAFEEATLEHRLEIGREIAKAQGQFGLNIAEKTAVARDSKALLSRRDNSPNTIGFAAWLIKEIPRLKRPTAIKYATAYQGLGLGENADNRAIKERIKKLRHEAGKAGKPMPSLGSLYKAGKPEKKEPLQIETPKDTAQLRLEDARETFALWRETFETALQRGQLDDLDEPGLKELKEFLAYARDRVNKRLK